MPMENNSNHSAEEHVDLETQGGILNFLSNLGYYLSPDSNLGDPSVPIVFEAKRFDQEPTITFLNWDAVKEFAEKRNDEIVETQAADKSNLYLDIVEKAFGATLDIGASIEDDCIVFQLTNGERWGGFENYQALGEWIQNLADKGLDFADFAKGILEGTPAKGLDTVYMVNCPHHNIQEGIITEIPLRDINWYRNQAEIDGYVFSTGYGTGVHFFESWDKAQNYLDNCNEVFGAYDVNSKDELRFNDNHEPVFNADHVLEQDILKTQNVDR